MENDSLLAIREAEMINGSFSKWERISVDIRDRAKAFQTCVLRHIRRSANCLVHNIAGLPTMVGDYNVWRQSLPPSVCNPDIGL